MPTTYIFSSSGELVELSKADPDALARRNAQDEAMRVRGELALKDTEQLDAELRAAGYPYPGALYINKLRSEAAWSGVPNIEVQEYRRFDTTPWLPILIKWLPKLKLSGTQFEVIYLLLEAKPSTRKQVAEVLIDHYERLAADHIDDRDWEQTIAACSQLGARAAKPVHYERILEFCKNPYYYGENQMWVEWLGKSKHPDARKELIKIWRKIPKRRKSKEDYAYVDAGYGIMRAFRKLKSPGTQKYVEKFLDDNDKQFAKYALKTIEIIDKAEAKLASG